MDRDLLGIHAAKAVGVTGLDADRKGKAADSSAEEPRREPKT